MRFILPALFLASAAVFAGEPAFRYEAVNGCTAALLPGEPTPVLEIRAVYSRSELAWPSQVSFPFPAREFQNAAGAEITFRCKGPKGGKFRLRLAELPVSRTVNSNTETFTFTGDWQPIRFTAKLTRRPAGKWFDAPRLVLDSLEKGETVLMERPAVKILPGTVPAPVVPEGWRALDTADLYVEPGSALDFSRIVPRGGAMSRVIVNAAGKTARANAPEVPVRFHVSAWDGGWNGRELFSPETIREYAAATARQGFNMVRFHRLDLYLMAPHSFRLLALKNPPAGEIRLPQTEDEIVFNPERLDGFFRLVAELKKQGVYLNLDAMTSFSGYSPDRLPSASRNPQSSKVRMFTDDAFRRNWVAGVKKLLSTRNPYTGLALKDDPVLAMVCFLNEQDILMGLRDYSAAFHPRYTAFLRRKYGSIEALRKAWGGELVPEGADFDAVPGFGAKRLGGSHPMELDMTEFASEMMTDMTEFYLQAMKEIGYSGICSNWNMRPYLSSIPARSLLPAIFSNFYYAHPQNGAVTQRSALTQGGSGFSQMATTRFLDRPFICTEFAICFWNRYRHEQGLLFGAGAALQDWDGLTGFSLNVVETDSELETFKMGNDPIARASEQIAALAFLRRDVKSAPESLNLKITPSFIAGNRLDSGLAAFYSRLWPLCRIGVTFGRPRIPLPGAVAVVPQETVRVGGGLLFTETDTAVSPENTVEFVKFLRSRGVLPAGNRTDPANGIYQSSTGELTVDFKEGEMAVAAPRLAGVVLKRDRESRSGALTVKRCTVPASLVAAALEEKPLETSERVLLFLLTDARSSGMKFADPEETRLLESGESPVIVRTGEFELLIRRKTPRPAKGYVLAVNGRRVGEVPVEIVPGGWRIVLDTARTPGGPSPYYELVETK